MRSTLARVLLVLTAPWLVYGCSGPNSASASEGAAAPIATIPNELLQIRLPDLSGTEHSISDVLASDRSAAVVFWQSWCASCVEEAPALARAHRDLADRLAVVGVVSGPDGSVNEFRLREIVKDLDLPYPNLRDRELTLTRGLEVTGTPTIFVLRPDGSLAFSGHEVPEDWDAIL